VSLSLLWLLIRYKKEKEREKGRKEKGRKGEREKERREGGNIGIAKSVNNLFSGKRSTAIT
jgi:hypothetical protein